MTKTTKQINDDLYYRDSRITNTDDPLQDYYSTLHSGSVNTLTPVEPGELKIKGHKIPDPKKHQIISFIKSAIRIGGYIAILFNLEIAALILIFSEVVGIIEELV
jgi:hypothetical protein